MNTYWSTREKYKMIFLIHQWLIGQGILHIQNKRSWSNTTPCTVDRRQNIGAIFTTRGRGRVPFIGGIDIRLAYQLSGKLAAEAVGRQLLIKLYNLENWIVM